MKKGLILLGCAAIVLVGFKTKSKSRTIEAEKIVLKSADGKECIEMRVDGDRPVIVMNYRQTSQVEISASDEGPVVKLNNVDGTPRVQIQGDVSPGMFLRNENGDVIGSFVAMSKGGSALGLANAKGEIAAFVRGGNNPSVSLYQNGRHPDMVLGISEKSPHILMSRNNAKEGMLIYGGTPSSLMIFNEQGQVPLILSKKGVMHARPKPAKSKEKKEQYFSWENPEALNESKPESDALPKN